MLLGVEEGVKFANVAIVVVVVVVVVVDADIDVADDDDAAELGEKTPKGS